MKPGDCERGIPHPNYNAMNWGVILAHKLGLSHSKKEITITKSIAASIPQYLRANPQTEDINNNK
jgi:hypothetical protein